MVTGDREYSQSIRYVRNALYVNFELDRTAGSLILNFKFEFACDRIGSGDLKAGDLKAGDLKAGDLRSGDLRSDRIAWNRIRSPDPPLPP